MITEIKGIYALEGNVFVIHHGKDDRPGRPAIDKAHAILIEGQQNLPRCLPLPALSVEQEKYL